MYLAGDAKVETKQTGFKHTTRTSVKKIYVAQTRVVFECIKVFVKKIHTGEC